MSESEKNLFTILEHVGKASLRIQENVPESVAELIEIDNSGPAKTEDGKPVTVYNTTQGRQFARLDEWPKNLLLELPKS